MQADSWLVPRVVHIQTFRDTHPNGFILTGPGWPNGRSEVPPPPPTTMNGVAWTKAHSI